MKKIPTEVYSRVCGYFRPVHQWNKGKQEEFSEREVCHPEDALSLTEEVREKVLHR